MSPLERFMNTAVETAPLVDDGSVARMTAAEILAGFTGMRPCLHNAVDALSRCCACGVQCVSLTPMSPLLQAYLKLEEAKSLIEKEWTRRRETVPEHIYWNLDRALIVAAESMSLIGEELTRDERMSLESRTK